MDWNDHIRLGIFKKPGQHTLTVGTTGVGKTQHLYYLLNGLLRYAPEETIIWMDTGKSAEILKLGEFGPCTVHSPQGRDVILLPKNEEFKERFTLKHFIDYPQLWGSIDKGRINIIALEPFFREPKIYSREISTLFRVLIDYARDYKLRKYGVIPLALFIDEIQWLVPAERTALCWEHNEGAKWFQRNIEMLRSMKIRIVAASQNWTKIRPGARESFSWLFIKRGARFGMDRQLLMRYNSQWMLLNNDQFILVYPDSTFSQDSITTEFFGTGEKLGDVEYYDNTGKDEEIEGPKAYA